MYINYRKSYLTDGTQVKITEELFNQLRDWERQGYQFHFSYIDLLKQQDDEMINNNRAYYRHNTSLEGALERENISADLLDDRIITPEDAVIRSEQSKAILMILNLCTEAQRRRFIKYYYFGFTLEKVAEWEGCSLLSVYRSIKKVEKKLIDLKNIF